LTIPIPPGSSPLRELAHAVDTALTLPKRATTGDELPYLRAVRDRVRLVRVAMRRLLADREIDDDPDGLMLLVNALRDEAADADDAPDPVRAFAEAVITTLTIAPSGPTSEVAYLQSARGRARRVLLAARRLVEQPYTDDRDLAAAIELLTAPSDDQNDDAAASAPEPAQ
jgi:hypothetical protein